MSDDIRSMIVVMVVMEIVLMVMVVMVVVMELPKTTKLSDNIMSFSFLLLL